MRFCCVDFPTGISSDGSLDVSHMNTSLIEFGRLFKNSLNLLRNTQSDCFSKSRIRLLDSHVTRACQFDDEILC